MPEIDNRPLVGKILLFSAIVLGILGALTFAGVVPVPAPTRNLLAFAFALAAVVDGAIALFLMTRS